MKQSILLNEIDTQLEGSLLGNKPIGRQQNSESSFAKMSYK